MGPQGGGGGGDAGHQAATLAQVGGAEVIHFKGKINDTINPCLGHCRGGRGRTHTRCWATKDLQQHTHTHTYTRMTCVNMHTHAQTEAYTAAVHTDTLSSGSFDMSSIHLASSGDETRGCGLYLGCRQTLDGGYWSDFTGCCARERERKRMTDLVNQ